MKEKKFDATLNIVKGIFHPVEKICMDALLVHCFQYAFADGVRAYLLSEQEPKLTVHLFGNHYLQAGRAITFGFTNSFAGNAAIDLLRIVKKKDGHMKDFGIFQRRYCDQNGKAYADVDYKHADDNKTHFFPHLHIIEGNYRGDTEPVAIFEGVPILKSRSTMNKPLIKVKGENRHDQIGQRTFRDD